MAVELGCGKPIEDWPHLPWKRRASVLVRMGVRLSRLPMIVGLTDRASQPLVSASCRLTLLHRCWLRLANVVTVTGDPFLGHGPFLLAPRMPLFLMRLPGLGGGPAAINQKRMTRDQ
jgi:hypothetical protein